MRIEDREQREEQIYDLWQKGLKSREIAQELGITVCWVRSCLRNIAARKGNIYKDAIRRDAVKPVTEEEKKRIVAMYKSGMLVKDIMKEVHRGENSVYKVIKAAGVSDKRGRKEIKSAPKSNLVIREYKVTYFKPEYLCSTNMDRLHKDWFDSTDLFIDRPRIMEFPEWKRAYQMKKKVFYGKEYGYL